MRGASSSRKSKPRNLRLCTTVGSSARTITSIASTTSAGARPGAANIRCSRLSRRLACSSGALSSDDNLEPVVRGGDGQLMRRSVDFGVPSRLAQHLLEHLVVEHGLVMVHDKVLDVRNLRELDRDHVARMSPILFHRDLIRERVLRIEDQNVSVAEKLDERVVLCQNVKLVLGVGRVNHRLAIL